jgi:hypothetical protein
MDDNLPVEQNYLSLVDIFDDSNSQSVVNKVDLQLSLVINDNREILEQLINESEGTLRARLKPTSELNILRSRFWEEYKTSIALNRMMKSRVIYSGICTMMHFFKNIATDPKKLGWILRQPREYTENITEIVDDGLESLREIMRLDIFQDDGTEIKIDENGQEFVSQKKKINMNIVNAKLKAFATLDTRLKGAPKQTIEKKTMGIHHTIHGKLPPTTLTVELTEEEKINQELLDSQQELIKAKYDPRITQEDKQAT